VHTNYGSVEMIRLCSLLLLFIIIIIIIIIIFVIYHSVLCCCWLGIRNSICPTESSAI